MRTIYTTYQHNNLSKFATVWKLMRKLALVIFLIWGGQTAFLNAQTTYVVTNTNNAGASSLRQAITDANLSAGVDTINFNIAGAGVHIISLTSFLPTITENVFINGWSEPDFVGTPVVRIDGASAGSNVDGLTFLNTSDGSTVRGLMITRFTRHGIQINAGADGVSIVGNWIGTTGTSSSGVGNGNTGIIIEGANVIVGGSGTNDRNVITNNGNEGITLNGVGAINAVIKGNYIGLDPDGSTGNGNADVGIAILSGANNTIIGGITVAERNLISRNFEGIEINSSNNVVQGNYIGTDLTGTLNRGNRSDDGVEVQGSSTNNLIGGAQAGAGNLIAYNALNGVNVVNGTAHTILGNRIHSNTNLGINLGTSGVTTNDLGDGDTGANNLQNFPVLTSANSFVDATTIIGSLNSNANTIYRIEFFSNPTGDGSGNGEGQIYLGYSNDTTDAGGNVAINAYLTGVSLTAGHVVSATATVNLGGGNFGNTSEFAVNITASVTPQSPGGVAGASIWLKADQGVTTGATLTWADQSGNNRNGVQSTATNQPTVSSSAFNFNPALTFDGTNDYLSVQNLAGLPTGAAQVQQFAVANNLNTFGSFQHIFTYGTGTLGRSFGLAKQNGTGNAATVLYLQDAISSSGEFSGGGLALLDGKYTGTNAVISSFGVQRITQAYSSNRTTAFGYVGVDPTLALSTCWNGNIPEVILYGSNLTSTQAQQVNSYLAIKYGITLDQTAPQNYLASDGSTIFWNGTSNSGFKNNIAGIARDDASALNQKQSKSVNSGFQIVLGNGNTIATTNALNTNNFSADISSLIWGDDAGSVTAWSTTGAPSDRQILARKWRVQETGTIGTVTLQVPDNSSAESFKLPTDLGIVYLLIDTDGDFSSGATSVAMTLNGTNWEVSGTAALTNGRYFTFATPTALATTFTQTNVTCNGASSGAIDLSVTGGVTPYTYNWGGVTTQDRTAIPAGSYNVTVTDNVGSTTTRSFIITELPILNATVNKTNATCNGNSTGTITVSAPTGGSGTYQYRLDTGAWQGSGNFTGLAAASYNVQIRDAANPSCTRTLGAHLVDQPVLLYATADALNVNCNAGTNGSINLTTTGGTFPYTFNWGGGITTEDRTGLGAGVYTVTITDNNGCTATASATVTQPAVLSATTTVTAVTCFSDGSINLTPTGGTMPYTYDWADVAGTNNTQDRSGLTVGTYAVTITDAKGCTVSTSDVLSAPICNPAALDICQSNTSDVFNVDPDPMVDSYTWTVPSGAVIVSGQGTPSIIVNWLAATTGAGQVCVKTVNVCTESADVCFDVNIRAVPATAVVLAAPVCTNENLELLATGGTSYSWSGPNGFTSNNEAPIIYNPSGLHDGTYAVTVTDIKGCKATASVLVSVKPVPIATCGITLAGCLATTGAVNLTVSSGASPYTYLWNNAAVTEDISGIAAGAYTVTVTDANGCIITHIAPVGNTPAPSVIPTVTNVACSSGATGGVALAVSGAAAPYTYNWSNGAITQNITSQIAGTYNVSVTDNLGCKTIVTNEILEPNALQIGQSQTNVNCFAASTGAIDITVTGGTVAYTYDWADIAGANNPQDRSSLAAGTYNLTVTDGNGCSAMTSIVITQPVATLSASTLVTHLLCNGVAEGVVNLTVTGGTSPYTYAWAGGATTEDRSSLAAGTYDVTITDDNGCTTTASGTVTQPTVLALSHTKIDISCNGGADGSINLSVAGGTLGYTYLWSDGATTQDIASKSAGNYTVTVTDANGCTATTSVTLTEPTVLASSHTVINVNCNNGATGAVDLTVTGGTAPYTYLWSNGETSQDISSKTAGTYSVTITDFKNCALVTTAIITQPTAISTSGLVTNVSCNGGNNGAINLTASGGTGVLTYNWGGGITTEDRSSLPIGTYTVTVTDANGCTASQSFSLTEPTALVLSRTSTNITCNGAADGSINLTASGGITPFTLAWSNGATTEDLNTLNIGTYVVTVTDANGCTATTSATLSQPTTLSTTPSVSNALCFGGNSGSISTTTTGGTSPYNYAWSNGGITPNLTNLIANAYTLTVTDANGCSTITNNTVTQPAAALDITASNITVSCFGGSDGSINTTTTGGTLPYTYAWSNGVATANINALLAGSYTVTVTDINLCTTVNTFIITEPAAALSLSSTQSNVTCVGNADGAISLTIGGGTLPYTFNWSNGATTQNINTLIAGTYDVTVTDVNNCTATTSVTITQPTAISLTSTIINAGCTGGNAGAIDLTVSGGTAPYTYDWSNGVITQDITSLIAGNFSVTVTDANNCTMILNNTITENTNPIANLTSNENSCTVDDDKVLSGGTVNLTASGGVTYTWDNGLGSGAAQIATPSVSTTYNVTVTDINGCTATASKRIDVISDVVASIVSNESFCTTNDDKVISGGDVSLSASGGVSYSWDNGLGTGANKVVNPTVNTTYTVTVTDVNGCMASTNRTIEIVTPPTASIISTENSCTINDDKILAIDSVRLIASGSIYFAWNNGLGSQPDVFAHPTATTTYTVTVTDANGCIGIASKTIEVVTAPTASMASTESSCTINDDKVLNGDNANLIASGGVSYAWDNGLGAGANQTVTPSLSTTYTVIATDINGCADTISKTIDVITAPIAMISGNLNIAKGDNTTLTASGGTAYIWSTTETTAPITIAPLLTANYSVTLTDANGCTDSETVTVSVNDSPVANADEITILEDNTGTTINVIPNDTFGDNGPNTSTIVMTQMPTNGIASINDNGTANDPTDDTIIYTPNSNFNGNDTLIYQICNINSDCDTAIVIIHVTPINDAPVAIDDNISTNEDIAISGTVAINDTDTEGDALTFTAITIVPASQGVLIFNPDGTYTFTPATNFNGVVVINYEVCDATKCDTAILTITVVPINDAPVAVDDNISTNEDIAISGTVATNDTDTEGDALTFTAITIVPASQGVLIFNPDGTYTFTPATNFNGVVTINYEVCDATTCDTATLIITVNAVNDAPVAMDDVITTNEDNVISGTVATNDTDTEGGALTFTAITTVPASEGVLIFNPDGTYTFTPATNFNGVVTINYEVCDATKCDTATLTITVVPVNDAPVAIDDIKSTNEDIAISGTVATNDTDTEGDALTFTAITIVPASQGVLIFNPDGTYTFTPATNFNGVVVINYEVCDATKCDTAILTITVVLVNDAPVAIDDIKSTNEDIAISGTVAINDTDTEGDALTFTSITTVPASQGVLIFNPDGTYTFTPATNFNGVVVINYEVCDATKCDTATLTITVVPVNDAPIAIDDVKSTNEDAPISGTVAINDTDTEGDALTFTSITTVPASEGVLVFNPDGTYTFTPATNFNGVVVINYEVCDATKCDTATLTITVVPVNDAPIAVDDNISTNEDVSISGTVATNDSDADGNALTFTAITNIPVEEGVFTMNPDGTYTFVPAEDFNGTVVIQYVVCDVFNACDTATLIIKVKPISDAPVADDAINSTRNDTPVSGTLVPNVTIIDKTVGVTFGQVGTISPTEGTIIINPDGTYTFIPNPTFVGVVTVVYVVCAGANACDTATLTITVTPTNQPPIANDDTNTTYKNNQVSGDVTPNDSDPDGNTLVFNISPVTYPANGTVVLNPNGTYTYTPNNGFVGTDVFTYQFCDNGFPTKCDTAKVTITVTDLPKTITSTIENTLIVQVTDTICLDTRELIGKKFTINNICPSSGQIVEYSIIAGTLCVKIVAISKGDDRGCFVVCDEFGLCDTTYIVTKVVDRTVTKRIKAVNDEVTTKKGEPVISVVMSNDSLYNEGVKDVVVVVQGNHGQAEVDSANNIIYTPGANFCGTDSITYQICSSAGCDMAVLKIKVICNGFTVFNGFSPNNDGSNETFVIEGLENFPNNKIEIYNRWGNRVYFSKNYQNDWGGTWGNKKLPDGTYYYLIDDGEGNHYTGYIQIHQ